jgi:pSer/pThr/pTyr-binding forkhead associated (FHA) protein
MCPTTLGRIHTRVATLAFLPALLGLILWAATGKSDWLKLLGIYLLLGVALDVLVYAWAIKYQPPWMTFVLAVAELGLLYALARVLDIHLTTLEAIGFYWASWLLAIGTKIVVLPIVSLTYLESAGEFRRDEWSIPPELELMPILPTAAGDEHGAVVEAASRGLHPSAPEKPNGRLVLVHEGADPPLEYAIRADMTIGRRHCDITIDDPAVDRRHAVIEHFSSGFGIRPLHADAAVVVNEQPVTAEWVLAPGDCISIGATRLLVESAHGALVPPNPTDARGDVPALEPVPNAISTLVEAAGSPAGEFAPPAGGLRHRRRSQATSGYATLTAFVIVLADSIVIALSLSGNT